MLQARSKHTEKRTQAQACGDINPRKNSKTKKFSILWQTHKQLHQLKAITINNNKTNVNDRKMKLK